MAGQPEALDTIFEARPDVLNHNLETVARLQRAVRPEPGYALLGVLGRARAAGLVTKSGLILGLGEEEDEVRAAIGDLAPWVSRSSLSASTCSPRHATCRSAAGGTDEFLALREYAPAVGFAHVESGPLVRSSYHARRASDAGARPSGRH